MRTVVFAPLKRPTVSADDSELDVAGVGNVAAIQMCTALIEYNIRPGTGLV